MYKLYLPCIFHRTLLDMNISCWKDTLKMSKGTNLSLIMYVYKQNNDWSFEYKKIIYVNCGESAAPVSQRSRVQIPYKPEFFSGFFSQL